MRLVPRHVDHCNLGVWHVCLAREEFAEGAIVTLEALCGVWCFGSLTHRSTYRIRVDEPDARICESCLAAYRQG